MGRHAVVYAALFALTILYTTAGGEDSSVGQELPHAAGYAFSSNVTGYLMLSQDICDMRELLEGEQEGSEENPNYAAAWQIYSDGKNSKFEDGTLRSLQGIAQAQWPGQPAFDLYQTYWEAHNISNYMDEPVVLAFNGNPPYETDEQRVEQIIKGTESGIQFSYLLHELDEAVDKIQAGDLDPATGAPLNVDQSFAIYAGSDPDCSIWGRSTKRGHFFGTMRNCALSEVNARMIETHNEAYQAAKAGDLDAFIQARREVLRLMTVTYIQSTLRYTQFLQNMPTAVTQNETVGQPGGNATAQAEGYAFYSVIAPVIAWANASADAAIMDVLYPGNPIPEDATQQVQAALESTYAQLNIEQAEIGTPGATQPELVCEDSPGPSVTQEASSTSDGGPKTHPGAAPLVVAGFAALLALLL